MCVRVVVKLVVIVVQTQEAVQEQEQRQRQILATIVMGKALLPQAVVAVPVLARMVAELL